MRSWVAREEGRPGELGRGPSTEFGVGGSSLSASTLLASWLNVTPPFVGRRPAANASHLLYGAQELCGRVVR